MGLDGLTIHSSRARIVTATSGHLIGRAGLIRALGAMRIFIVALAMLVASGEALACRCITGRTLPQEKALHDRVFVGQVTSINPSQSGVVVVSFKVSSSLKGKDTPAAVVLVPGDASSCGYVRPFFTLHNTYTVFADQAGPVLETSRCSPNSLGLPPKSIAKVLQHGT